MLYCRHDIVLATIACYDIIINSMHHLRPTIVIVCRNIDEDLSPFNSGYYLKAYADLLLAVKHHGANVYFSTKRQYRGKGLFDKAYTISSRVPVKNFTEVTSIYAHLVYNKGDFADVLDIAILNPPYVHTITSNKHETYKFFSAYQPISHLCHNIKEITIALREVPGSMIVVKSLTGNGGHGVSILKREDINTRNQSFVPIYPVLVQEFLDTSCGIPGMAEGIHDLRIKIGGGDVWGGTLRIPCKGELRANVAQGGSEQHLFPNQIPKGALDIAIEIDRYFIDYPRYYSIDLVRTKGGWKLSS